MMLILNPPSKRVNPVKQHYNLTLRIGYNANQPNGNE
jgi:hypothetical protein